MNLILILIVAVLIGMAIEIYTGKQQTNKILERINTMADDLATQLSNIEDQLSKASTEIVNKINELQNLIGTIPPEAQAKLDEIKATAQALDDIVPDQPPPGP